LSGATRSIVKFTIFVILLFVTLTMFMGPEFALVIVIIVVVASIGGIIEESSRS
jgi:hypothetical protein